MKHLGYRFGATCLARMANDRQDSISFETFCEYLLPYRIDDEPLA